MKILTVIGARPQFVKAATVSRVIKSMSGVEEILVHTGQHYDKNMSQIFFDELDIPKPHYHLEIGSASHGKQTGAMLADIEAVLLKEKPDYVLVYGDTNSTLAGALAAAKLHIPVAHVEAGLRSFNRTMPEEINRIVTDHTSTLLFAPSTASMKNLTFEGLADKSILVGDVMYDAVKYYLDVIAQQDRQPWQKWFSSDTNFILCTLHRAENTDDSKRLSQIVDALNALHKKIPIILPLHPRTKAAIVRDGLSLSVKCVDPLGYLDMLALTSKAHVVVTDSGGLQKEAYFCGTPCLTMRSETEWVELLEIQVNKLTSPDKLLEDCEDLPNHTAFKGHNVYGAGNTAQTILSEIMSFSML